LIRFHPGEKCAKCGSGVHVKEFKVKNIVVREEYLILECDTCGFKFKRAPLNDNDKGEIKEPRPHGKDTIYKR
jgi:hypothetical protein